MKTITFADVLRPTFDRMRTGHLKRRLVNIQRDAQLSNDRIKNAYAVIADEDAHLKKLDKEQINITSELRDLGAGAWLES